VTQSVYKLGYGLDDRGSIPGRGNNGIFLSSLPPYRPALRPTQPPIQRVPAALSPGVKQPVREADHPLLSSAEDKNAWSYTSTPVGLHGVG